ncbi:MAG: 30S ribosome-binding factor RbfA [Acidobacteriota bacterium]
MGRRNQRVAEGLRAELANLLLFEVKDPRVRLATVTAVELNSDMSRARVRVSVMGEDEDREEAVAALRHAAGFLRTQIAKRLRLRQSPELLFELDRGAEYSQHISDLLEQLHVDDDS